MPAKRISIYVGDSLARSIAALSVHLGADTAAINTLADRWQALLSSSRPELTLDEWCAIAEANSGVWMQSLTGDTPIPTLQLLGETDEAGGISPDDPAVRWEVDAARVNQILTALPLAGRLAVLDVVEQVWANPTRGTRACLQAILAPPSA